MRTWRPIFAAMVGTACAFTLLVICRQVLRWHAQGFSPPDTGSAATSSTRPGTATSPDDYLSGIDQNFAANGVLALSLGVFYAVSRLLEVRKFRDEARDEYQLAQANRCFELETRFCESIPKNVSYLEEIAIHRLQADYYSRAGNAESSKEQRAAYAKAVDAWRSGCTHYDSISIRLIADLDQLEGKSEQTKRAVLAMRAIRSLFEELNDVSLIPDELRETVQQLDPVVQRVKNCLPDLDAGARLDSQLASLRRRVSALPPQIDAASARQCYEVALAFQQQVVAWINVAYTAAVENLTYAANDRVGKVLNDQTN